MSETLDAPPPPPPDPPEPSDRGLDDAPPEEAVEPIDPGDEAEEEAPPEDSTSVNDAEVADPLADEAQAESPPEGTEIESAEVDTADVLVDEVAHEASASEVEGDSGADESALDAGAGQGDAATEPSAERTQDVEYGVGEYEPPTEGNDVPDASQRVPLEDPRVERAWESSMETDAGRAYYAEGDSMREAAAEVSPRENVYTVDLHGNSDEVVAGTLDGDVTLTPSELGDLVRSDPEWNGEPVRLLSCETGSPGTDGSEPFAQSLADDLGVDVIAPDGYGNSDKAGNVYSVKGRLTEDGEFIETGPHVPDTGWPVFHPRVGEES